MKTIGLVANMYCEANALPGWIETHLPFFDDIRVLHAGPGGAYSDDGTIEILEKWKIPIEFCAIDDGFGVVRTKALRMSKCDFIMLLDADERFFACHQVLTCAGESTPPDEVNTILQSYDFRDLNAMACNWENIGRLGAKLNVTAGASYNQGVFLRELLEHGGFDAIRTVRRHWHDFSFKRPTQNWHTDPDYQQRLVRNDVGIGFDQSTKMHERQYGAANVFHPNFTHGPFFDHFHFTFKQMEMSQRQYDIAIYDALHENRPIPTKEEFKAGKR